MRSHMRPYSLHTQHHPGEPVFSYSYLDATKWLAQVRELMLSILLAAWSLPAVFRGGSGWAYGMQSHGAGHDA